jgi:hypothetical protein
MEYIYFVQGVEDKFRPERERESNRRIETIALINNIIHRPTI